MIEREPIVGWREWRFMRPHYLSDFGTSMIVEPRQRIEAFCRFEETRRTHQEPAPVLDCTCGIYAYNDRNLLGWAPTNLIKGEIYLWGRVIEHVDGWRAQFAYPKSLQVPPELEHLIGWMQYKYGVPVTGYDNKVVEPDYYAKDPLPRQFVKKIKRIYTCGHEREYDIQVSFSNYYNSKQQQLADERVGRVCVSCEAVARRLRREEKKNNPKGE